MIENCVWTEGEVGVALLPSKAARTARASACRPLRMRSRGESGRKGHMAQTRIEKTFVVVSRALWCGSSAWNKAETYPSGKQAGTATRHCLAQRRNLASASSKWQSL